MTGQALRRFSSRSTASRMNDTCVSSLASADCMRASVPSAKAASRFSGYSIFRPTRDGLAHMSFSAKPFIFRICPID